MTKKILIILYIPMILYAGNVYHDYYFDTPQVRDGKVSMNGCRPSYSPGKPYLVVKPVILLLPKGQEAVSYEVQYDGFTTLNSKYEIKPFPAAGESENVTRSIYNQNAFYPNSVKSGWFRTQYKNGNGIFITTVNPVQYNPVTKELQYCRRISVTVQTRYTRSDLPYKCTSFIKSRIASLVDNPEAVRRLPLTPKGADDYEYLIITSVALKDSWDALIEFNTRRCLRTRIQVIDTILANMSGVDDAEKMRNYIKQEYTDHNIVYALLGGDADEGPSLPGRLLYAKFYDHHIAPDRLNETYTCADLYYSCLDGNWNNNLDSKYGEPGEEDMYWEVYTARFPVDDATDLSNIINKTIKYSESPVANQVTKCFLAGEYLWTNGGTDVYGGDYTDQFVNTCSLYGYTTQGIPTATWSVDSLYDRFGTDWPISQFRNTFNTFKPAWINTMGHGNASISVGESASGVTNTNYQNDGTNANYFLLIAQSASSGNFDGTNNCILELFVNLQNGAVACIGYDGFIWGDDDGSDGACQRPMRHLHDVLFSRKIHHLEAMHAGGKEANADIVLNGDLNTAPYYEAVTASIYGTNLLGDPALSIWTATPDSLDPTYDTLLADSSFEIQTPSYSWVALCTQTQRGDSIICTQLTDSGGSCVIDDQILADYVGANPGALLKVNIKAHNYYPYQGNLYIKAVGAIDISSPNGGEEWERGQQYSITWDDIINENVKIELYKGGVAHSTISSSIPSTSPYSWTISDTITPASDYKIKITSVTNANAKDTSDNNFTIYEAIIISSHPVNDTALDGGTAGFGISASGYNLAFQWQRNDGGWHNVPSGGDTTSYSFSAGSGDNDVWFRCAINSGPVADTSDSALLKIGTLPSVPDQFSSDTVLAVNGGLTLTASATAFPTPSYEWFFISPVTQTPVSKSTGTTLSLTGMDKGDSGTYYFVATNSLGSTSSDSIFAHVLTPVSIVVDLPTTYTAVNGGEALFSIDVVGDGTMNYQWYQGTTAMPSETNSSFRIDTVDSAAHHGKTYYCDIANTHLGMTVGTATSATSTLNVSKLYNPFKLKAERVDLHNTTQVRLKLWSNVDISDFPSTQSSEPWADSVWIMYKTNDYAADTSEALSIRRYSIDAIKQAVPDSVKEIVTVGELQGPHDSCYWFNYSVFWHDPNSEDILLEPFTEANRVFMFDTITPSNPLAVNGEYFNKSDSARLIIENISLLNATTDSSAIFQCSRFPTFTPLVSNDTVLVSELIAAGNKDTIIIHNLGTLPIETDTAYCRWFVIGKNKKPSTNKSSDFMIGWDRPVYSGQLSADTTARADQAQLTWDSPAQGTDSIRVWWDTQKIPLTHDITLPAGQAFYVLTSVVKDTVSNLNPETMYYFGLQIFKDMMWSKVTELASDSVMTPKADPSLIIPNQITIDTAWFDTSFNLVKIGWTVDTIGLTTDSTYLQYGHSYSIDPDAFKTTQPSQWTVVSGITAVSSIALGSNIVFDTTYHAGMWLRKCKNTGGVGLAAGPGDTVSTFVRTPSYFTWQEITLSSDKPDTVYAFNGKIIIISITPFDFTDTLRGYNRQVPLPSGIVDLGGTGFRFSKPNLQIPDFKIGMRYNPTRSLITNNNKNIYKDITGPLNVIYGSEAEDSVVWTIISGADMAYPFLVLADTVKPTISFEGTITDTAKILDPDSLVTTQFKVSDNISNVKWEFIYGAGNMSYAYGTNDSLDSMVQIVTTTIPVSDNVVSIAYGLRALFIVDDGVYSDTINVSRRVRTANSDAFSTAPKEWIPLRATSSLLDTTPQAVLSNFTNDQGVWEYDRTKFLMAQWYDTTGGFSCEVIEYSDALHEDFCLIPGRIIWLKTAEAQVFNFGAGVTTSLKETYTMTINGNCWTDFSLPYKFSVKLKDILAATGNRSDSLVFYNWAKSDSTYTAVATYIPALDSASGKLDTLKLIVKPGSDAYTVYNYSSVPIVLNIPPTPPALSPVCKIRTQPDQKQQNIWDISLLWKKENSSFINSIRCGYNCNSTAKTLIGPMPPSFGKIGAGVSDGNGKIGGYAIHNRIDKGGLNYEIVFYNTSQKSETIEYFLDNPHLLPEGYSTCMYNPATAEFEKDKTSVTLKANSSERRWLVIGTENYLNGFIENNIVSSFSFLGAYPNPFRGRINLRYLVPWQGVKKIQFRIFDLQGRIVWEKDLSEGVKHGLNEINLNISGRNGQHIASGIYLLQMKIYENGKKGYRIFQRKLTCLN